MDGTVHRVYVDRQERLVHASHHGGSWSREVLDARKSSIGGRSIAVDALGRLHATYVVESASAPTGTPWVVVHGVLDSLGWTVTELLPGDGRGVLAIGPEGNPRVLFATDWTLDESGTQHTEVDRLRFATFDGDTWSVEDTGLRGEASSLGHAASLVIDDGGHAHALVGRGWYRQFYATNASGTWQEETLPFEPSGGSLGFDSAGLMHVVANPFEGGVAPGLRHAWHDGSAWNTEEIPVPGNTGSSCGSPVVLMGEAGQVSVLYLLFPDAYTSEWPSLHLALRDVQGWSTRAIAKRFVSSAEFAAAVGPDGALHAVSAGRDRRRVLYIRASVHSPPMPVR